LIEGSICDASILRSYALRKNWAGQSNAFFAALFERHRGGTYIDVGANIGLTTIPIARDPRVSCKAFEPEPDNYRYLRNNLQNNCGHDNVETFNVAVFDEPGTVELELSRENLGDHRIRVLRHDGACEEGKRAVVEVAADRLDNLLDVAVLKKPIAVKIDTQGAESQVFSGGRSLIAAAEAVSFEFWPYGMARTSGDVRMLTQFIATNFSAGAIMRGDEDEPPIWRPIEFVAATLNEFAMRHGRSPLDYCDVFVRKS
jgi:FkbM family methyltransferase